VEEGKKFQGTGVLVMGERLTRSPAGWDGFSRQRFREKGNSDSKFVEQWGVVEVTREHGFLTEID